MTKQSGTKWMIVDNLGGVRNYDLLFICGGQEAVGVLCSSVYVMVLEVIDADDFIVYACFCSNSTKYEVR